MLMLAACGKPEQAPVSASDKPAVTAGSAVAVTAPSHRTDDKGQPAGQGRYQIVINPQARGAPFLLDTQAGRIWQLRDFPGLEGSPAAWREMTIIDDTGATGITTAQFQKLYPLRRPPQRR
jgi:hypothetical protein